jgi:hypothetical protein
LPPGGTWERDLRWEVPAAACISTAAGLEPAHDDRLLSAALVASYDDLVAAGTVTTGWATGRVVCPAEPLDGLRF